MVSNIDFGLTAAIVFPLVTTAVAVIITDVFGKYEKKTTQIKTSLLGYLRSEVDNLVNEEINNRELKESKQKNLETSEQEEYTKLISFFRDSRLFNYTNDYEEILDFESNGDGKINKLAISFGAFAVPVFLLQQEGSMYTIGVIWFLINLVSFFSYLTDVTNMVYKIKKLYREHIIKNQSFGGYDL